MIRLAHNFNKTIRLCVASLFEDQQPRTFKLVRTEEFDLWLESEELAKTLEPQEGTRPPQAIAAAFFPFSHIAYVLAATCPMPVAPMPQISVEPKEPQRHHTDERSSI